MLKIALTKEYSLVLIDSNVSQYNIIIKCYECMSKNHKIDKLQYTKVWGKRQVN